MDASEQAIALFNTVTGDDLTLAKIRAMTAEEWSVILSRALVVIQTLPDDELLWFMGQFYELCQLAGGEHADFAAKMKRLGMIPFRSSLPKMRGAIDGLPASTMLS